MEIGGIYKVIDTKGNIITENLKTQHPVCFQNGVASAYTTSKKTVVINTKGEVVSKNFGDIGDFSYNRAFALSVDGKKFGFIDSKGEWKIEIDIKSKAPSGTLKFQDALYPVSRRVGSKDLYGFIDTNGTMVIEPQFFFFRKFNSGRSAVKDLENTMKWGIFDTKGKMVTGYEYDYISEFRNGFALAHKDGKSGVIDRMGRTIMPFIYDGEIMFSNGVAVMKTGGRYGIINPAGDTLTPITFDLIAPFSEGFAIFKQNEKFGYMDTTGRIAVEPRFEIVSNFHNIWKKNAVNLVATFGRR